MPKSNVSQTQTPATNAWEKADASVNRGTFAYLNVALEVAEGVLIQLPINCPLGHDIERMSANQKALMEALEAKMDAALESGYNEALVLNCKVHARISPVGREASVKAFKL